MKIFGYKEQAILYQLKYKEKTDEERLFRYILRRASSDEFFVQKAIGWALREYAKTQPDNVKKFVSQHTLKPLSEREALKHFSQRVKIRTQKKPSPPLNFSDYQHYRLIDPSQK